MALGSSPEHDALVVTTHLHRLRFEVWQDDQFVMTLPVIDGGVDVDRNNKIVSSFTATIGDPGGKFSPASIRDILSPIAGTEVKPFAGLAVPIPVDYINRLETADDWAGGRGYGTVTTVDGYLTMA